MMLLVGSLTALLAVQDATSAAPTTTRAPCEPTDNACQARVFVAKSTKAPPAQRALYLFTAHRSYLALFAQTGKLPDLCAARKNFDRSLAVKGQSEKQRASFEASRTKLEALEKQHGGRCNSKPRKGPEPTAVAQTAISPPVEAPVSVASTILLVAEPEPTELGELLRVPPSRTLRRPVPQPQPAERSTSPRTTSGPGRPMVIAGGTTLGIGLVLTGIAGYAGWRVADASGASFDLYDETHGQGDADALAREADLRREFGRWIPVTVGTAIAGSTAVIVGAVLVRMGVRKMRQGPSRAAMVPVPGGLAFRARF